MPSTQIEKMFARRKCLGVTEHVQNSGVFALL